VKYATVRLVRQLKRARLLGPVKMVNHSIRGESLEMLVSKGYTSLPALSC
jgi:hypothetical protein